MARRWDATARQDLGTKISNGEIDPNNTTASYLGDIVSGTFYPEYQQPPPNGRASAIKRFRDIFRKIQAHRELTGQRHAIPDSFRGEEEGEEEEEEGKIQIVVFSLSL